MAMSHEFERHIRYAEESGNKKAIEALNALRTQYEILALAGIVPVLPVGDYLSGGNKQALPKPSAPWVRWKRDLTPPGADNNEAVTLKKQVGKDNVERLLSEHANETEGGADRIRYTTEELTHMFRPLSKRNIYYWEQRGLIQPEKVGRGTRSGRRFSPLETLKIGYMWYIIAGGRTVGAATKYAEYYIDQLSEEKSQDLPVKDNRTSP